MNSKLKGICRWSRLVPKAPFSSTNTSRRGGLRASRASFFLLVLTLLLPEISRGQAAERPHATAQSSSKQFIVQGPLRPFGSSWIPHGSYQRLFLDPAVVAVNCDQIKSALLTVLDMRDEWRGKIFVKLRPVTRDNDQIQIRTVQTSEGSTYYVVLPNEITTQRLVRAVVEVLLREIAGRTPGHAIEALPEWLPEGLTTLLIAEGVANFALQSEIRVNEMRRRSEVLALARASFRTNQPLSFDQLSWPVRQPSLAVGGENFRYSSYLFVHSLLQLRQGAESLQSMIRELPLHLNWQLSFLKSFRLHFAGLIEVEKWWAMTLIQFAGREPSRSWLVGESLDHLDQVLRLTVRVSADPQALPVLQELSLREAMSRWELEQQRRILTGVIEQLQFLRVRAAPEVAALADDYRRVLEQYFTRVPSGGGSAGSTAKGRVEPAQAVLLREAVRKLELLDRRRAELRQNPGQTKVAGRP